MPREKTHRFQSTETFHVIASKNSSEGYDTRFAFPTLARAQSFAETFKKAVEEFDGTISITRTVRPVADEHVIVVT